MSVKYAKFPKGNIKQITLNHNKMRITRYRIQLQSDKRKIWITTAATSIQSAIKIVMCSECCPESAILQVITLN
jgi:hypothetical protein